MRFSLATSLSTKSMGFRGRQASGAFVLRAVVATLLAAGFAAAHAQQAPNAGDVMRETSRPPSLPPKAEPQLPKAQEVRPALQDKGGFKLVVNGFRITGNKSIPENDLQLLLLDNLGKDNTFNDLQTAAAAISNYYRNRGYFVARAYLPQQEIQGGIVEIAVLEGTVGKATPQITGTPRTKPEVLQRILDANVPAGSVVREASLERAALLANDLPGMAASVTLDPGSQTGQTDVTLNATEGKMFNATVDVDNYGNNYTGSNRLGTTLYFNSPLGLGDQASVRLMTSDRNLNFARLNYQVPVGGNGMRVGAAWSKVNFEVCCQTGIDPSGAGRVASLYMLQPLARSRDFSAYFNAGIDNKESVNRSGVGPTRVRNLDVLTLGTSVESRDTLGGGGLMYSNASLSMGHVGIKDPTDQSSDAAGPNVAGGFTKLGVQVARTQRLTDRFSLYGGINSQLASKNLDPVEKFSLGGAQGVRSYASGEATGDRGYIAQVELRADLPIQGSLQWQGFLFTDYGNITVNRNNYVVAGLTPNSYSLKSWGLGLNVAKTGTFQIRAMWATGIGDNPGKSPINGTDAEGKTSRSRLWFQAVTQF
jgi:hemolysin activation/secretion protein